MQQERKVYRDYTQAELDRNFDQRGWCPNALDYISRYPEESIAARSARTCITLAYGEGRDEQLDFFLAGSVGAPTMVFVHGGAWRNFTKNDFSFVARAFADAGFNCVVVNFSKLPEARLPDLVEQLRRATVWIARNISQYGGTPDELYLCGHSSGAHLGAMLLSTNWREYGLKPDAFVGAALISGSYDIEPAVLSARGSYIHVTKAEERALSPLYFTSDLCCPVFVAYTANDTDEFKRQSIAYAEAARTSGKLLDIRCMEEENHFSSLEKLKGPHGVLLSIILDRLSRVAC